MFNAVCHSDHIRSLDREIRGDDRQGSGLWMASRGKRKHLGIDLVCRAGEQIYSDVSGKVTKIGYPYNPGDKKKGHLRYVEVTIENKSRIRYFYLDPLIIFGNKIEKGELLGTSQDLTKIYAGITQHFHLEVIAYVQPLNFLESYNELVY